MLHKKVTMVAFHGDDKPEALGDLVRGVQEMLSQQIGPSFTPSPMYQIHGTVLGMEANIIDENLIGHWFQKNRGERRQIDIGQLLRLADGIAKGDPIFTIRYGGFTKAVCACAGKTARGWTCATSPAEFHSCGLAPYQGSFYIDPSGSVLITGWPVGGHDKMNVFPRPLYNFRLEAESAGFLDKYHGPQNPSWKDDELYIKVGRSNSSTPRAQPTAAEEAVRELLRGKGPTAVSVTEKDISIILYDNARLAQEDVMQKVALREAIDDPTKVVQMYG